MHKESIVMGIAGMLLGVLGGWIIGSQQAATRAVAPTAASAQPAGGTQAQGQGQRGAPAIDETRIAQLKADADKDPRNARARVQLGNTYFDGERYDEAARWYTAALDIDPNDPNVSTDLGIAYYYMNQTDRALQQFERSLQIDSRHSKTLLNIGVVRAFGKQDLDGAARAWERVLEVAPNSEEATRAKQGLDGIRAAHPAGTAAPPKGPGSSN